MGQGLCKDFSHRRPAPELRLLHSARTNADRRERRSLHMGDQLAASELGEWQHGKSVAAVAGRRRSRAEPTAGMGTRRRGAQENPGRQSGAAVRVLSSIVHTRERAMKILSWLITPLALATLTLGIAGEGAAQTANAEVAKQLAPTGRLRVAG